MTEENENTGEGGEIPDGGEEFVSISETRGFRYCFDLQKE